VTEKSREALALYSRGHGEVHIIDQSVLLVLWSCM